MNAKIILSLLAVIGAVTAAPAVHATDDQPFSISDLPNDAMHHVASLLHPKDLVTGLGGVNRALKDTWRNPQAIVDAMEREYGREDVLRRAANGRIPDLAVWRELISRHPDFNAKHGDEVMRGVAKLGNIDHVREMGQEISAKLPEAGRHRLYRGAYVGAAQTGNTNLMADLEADAPMTKAHLSRMIIKAAEAGNLDTLRHLWKPHEISDESLSLAIDKAVKNNHIGVVDYLVNHISWVSPEKMAQATRKAHERGGSNQALEKLTALKYPDVFERRYYRAIQTGNWDEMRRLDTYEEMEQVTPQLKCDTMASSITVGRSKGDRFDAIQNMVDRCDAERDQAAFIRVYTLAVGPQAEQVREMLDSIVSLSPAKKEFFRAVADNDADAVSDAISNLMRRNELDDAVPGIADFRITALIYAGFANNVEAYEVIKDRLTTNPIQAIGNVYEGVAFGRGYDVFVRMLRDGISGVLFSEIALENFDEQLQHASIMKQYSKHLARMTLLMMASGDYESLWKIYSVVEMQVTFEEVLDEVIAMCQKGGYTHGEENLRQFKEELQL